MAAFGLGTLPNLLAISAWFSHLSRLARVRFVRLPAAALVAAAGVTGLVHAARPAVLSAHGWLCLELPGAVSLLTGGG
jgi:sulfite exporter TauE/SafE